MTLHVPPSTVSRPPLSEPPSRRLLAPVDGLGPRSRLFFKRAWGHLKDWSDYIDQSWIGAVIGVLVLAAMLWGGLFLAAVFG